MEKSYTDLKPNEVDYIVIKNTDAGPDITDIYFLIFSKDHYWEIPHSGDNEFLDWLQGFPHVNMEQFMKSMYCTKNRIFILYRGEDYPVLSEAKKEELTQRLSDFLDTHFSLPHRARDKIVKKLFNQYSQPKREYHNLEHIMNCLWELDQLPNGEIDKVQVELAIWYHDYVYNPILPNNTKKSAKVMMKDLKDHTTNINLDDVYKIILSDPDSKNLTYEQKVFLDIDFSILGQRELEYMAYQQNLKMEFRLLPSLILKIMRKTFLKNVIKRGVFHTALFKNKYQANAYKNIEDELSHWTYRILPTLAF